MRRGLLGTIFAAVVVLVVSVAISGADILPNMDLLESTVSSLSTEQASQPTTRQKASAPDTGTNVPTYTTSTELNNEPVDLTLIVPYYQGAVEIEQYGLTDTMGNKYSSGLRGYMSPADPIKYDMDCFCIWDIGGKYKTLTATGIIRAKDKGSKYEGSYKIYGDGRLLYSKDSIGCMTKPYQITIDISGVTDLKIEMYGNGNMGTSGINSVLADVILHP